MELHIGSRRTTCMLHFGLGWPRQPIARRFHPCTACIGIAGRSQMPSMSSPRPPCAVASCFAGKSCECGPGQYIALLALLAVLPLINMMTSTTTVCGGVRVTLALGIARCSAVACSRPEFSPPAFERFRPCTTPRHPHQCAVAFADLSENV